MASYLTIATKNHTFIKRTGDGDDEAIDTQNDVYLDEHGNIVLVEDKYALADIITHVARTNKGELRYNLSKGVPYMDTIFSSPPNIMLWQSYLRSSVEATEGIISVTSFEFDVSVDGDLTYTLEANSNIGEVSANG